MFRTKTIILILAVCCLVASVAVAQDQYPPAGDDVVNTTADISIYDPADSTVLLEVVAMEGRAVIHRGDPYTAAGDILTIDTRMDTLLLSGFSITQGDSMFATLDRSGPLSTGQIYQITAHVDFPAESFFDVHYRITFGSAPNPPSPGQGPNDDATYRGSFDFDMLNQSASMSQSKGAALSSERPKRVPVEELADKGARSGGDNIALATSIPALPYTDSDNTCQYQDDYDEVCPYDFPGAPDVVYAYTATADTFITITTCNTGSQYDTKLYVYENTYTPGVPYACNDDACPDWTSTINCMWVRAGNEYFIVVDGYDGTSCGIYEMFVDYCAPSGPCVVDCAPNWKPENEACGTDNNGGCNGNPPTWEQIDCGDTICGSAWADGGSRDTDWYEFTLTGPTIITVTGEAEFPFVLGFVDTSDCALAAAVDPSAVGDSCEVITASRVAGPGTYWVFAGPNVFEGVSCGVNSTYWFTLKCTPIGWDPDPPHVRDTIWQIPPHGRVYVDPRRRPVVDPLTGDTVAWVWHRHNVNPPDSANDTIPTIGIMNVWIGPNPPVVGQPADDVIELEGQVIIHRGEPTEDGSGHRTVQTEILSMDLSGFSPIFGQTILQVPEPAPGQIRGDLPSPQMFPASCSYNVDYEVFFPEQGMSIIPMQPPVMSAQIEAIPPRDVQLTTQGEPHPVENPQNPGIIVGWVTPIHWVDPPPQDPPPPPDTLPTIGMMPVIVGPAQPSPSQGPDETIELTGLAILQRQPPTTNGSGQRTVQTEILSMDLSGSSSLFGEVILSLPLPSPGEITSQTPGADFPADVFFDVDYQVDLPSMGHSIIPFGAVRMSSVISEIPPFDNQLTPDDGDWHPVYDPDDPSGDTLGWVRPIHWVQPPSDTCDQFPGDVNDDGAINQADVTYLIAYINCLGPAPVPLSNGDVNGDCVINQADVDYLVAYIFQGGPPPVDCTCVNPATPNCDDCPTGWTPGVDTIIYSAFEIDVFDPNDNTIYLGTAYAFGAQMIVQRNAPYVESPGIWRMDTDILQFSGAGASPLMGGPFTVGLDPNGTSSGFIRMCDSCNDNWAESFWNIDYQISTSQPPPRDLLHGNAQMELPCSEGWDPSAPPHGHTYVDPRKVPIYDADGTIIGYTIKRHRVADQPFGACCEAQTGLCFILTRVDCEASGGTYQGDDTSCDPNPCICTGWTPGIDTILYSAFEVELFDPSDSTVSLGTLTAFGSSMIVQRSAPYEPVPGSGIWRMDTDIIAFGGGGTSPIVGGLFTLELDPDLISGGWIQMCDSCNDNWAESHWDINYRILTSLPAPMNILKGNAQMDLPCDEQWDPFPGGIFTPPNGSTYIDPRKVPIYDADGNIIGYTMKKHRVDKDPMGACCEPQGGILCFIVTAEECEALGGIYLGDNTVCNPNPCDSTCPTGWTPGIDTILYSAFVVDYYDPTDSTVLLGTLTAFGANMVVQRSAPYEESPGIWRMNTTILEFGGAGTSALVGGPFTLQLDASLASTGFIRMCDSCNDNWAESKFTVHYQILTTQPAPDDVLEGTASMHLPCDEQWNPFPGGVFTPPNGHTYVDPRKVPIYDADGTIIGYTWKKHRVDNDPMGACCDPPTGGCRITTAQDCEQSGGVYLGDNVPCDPNPCDEPVGACCEQGTGLCFVMTQVECEASGGTYIGDGVSCNPNPCDSCETGWTPGVDTIPTHDFEIELYDNTGTILVTTMTASGINMIVQRGAPFLVSPGIYRMNTQIIQLDGSGNDPVLGGPFEIHLAAAPPSTGYIQMCDSCNDNWAFSYFQVHWVITTTLPFPMDVLTGDPAEMYLDCEGNWDPFGSGAFLPPYDIPYFDPRIVPIYDASGQLIGHTRKRHTPRDPSCCRGEMRGNIDNDALDQIDISDLVYLVDYMFTGGPAPVCWPETNVDCSDAPPAGDGSEDIDISDLVYLVDYMFNGGPPPCPCDCVPNEVCYPDWGVGKSSSTMGEETLRRWSSFARPSNAPSNTPRGFEFEPTR